MSDFPGGKSFDTKRYQRPQQTWVCGHHAAGAPCQIGPSGRGECKVHQICVPWFDGTDWHCTRARVWGGRCQEGPVPDPKAPKERAACPHWPVACEPVRSLRSHRRRLTVAVAAAALGFCLLVLGGSSGSSSNKIWNTAAIVSPGELSAAHASLKQGCSGCHSAASSSPLDLLNFAFGGHHGMNESHKCLECHQELGEHALRPHGVSAAILARETARFSAAADESQDGWNSLFDMLPQHPATEGGELACATCHHEHHGADFDLAAMSNAQCQSCHASTFASFSDGHPEFPPGRRAAIYFDHATHLQNYFPAPEPGSNNSPETNTSRALACSDCHTLDASGQTMVLGRFEHMCGQCHSGQIADDRMPRELRLPGTVLLTLNLAELRGRQAGDPKAAGDWPSSRIDPHVFANRFHELPPFMEVLLLADDEARAALATLRAVRHAEPGREVHDLSGDRAAYAAAIKRLIDELVTQREAAVTRRLSIAADEQRRDGEQIDKLADGLSHAGFFTSLAEAQEHWFPDSLAKRKPGVETPQGAVADATSAALFSLTGGWTISKDGLTLRYHSRGHADPLLRALLDFAAASATQYPEPPSLDERGVFDRMFRRLAAPESTGRCMKCHTVETAAGGGTIINWDSVQRPSAKREFTRFAHGPHLTLLSSETEAQALGSENRCEMCHPVRDRTREPRKSAFLLSDWMPNPDCTAHSTVGLASVERASCATCHTPELAGDNCLQCHNYHIDAPSVASLPTAADADATTDADTSPARRFPVEE